MNCRMTAGAPTGALAQEGRMRRGADINLPAHVLNLGVTAQTEIKIILGKHLPVD